MIRNPLRHFSPNDLVTVGYIAAVAQTALSTGVAFILFPELGALAHDVFERPGGRWARAPILLAITPAIAAVLGLAIARTMHYGLVAVGLGTIVGIGVVAALRSPIAPAISAGLLPVVFAIHSWWYPLSILGGTTALAIIGFLHRRWMRAYHGIPPASSADRVADILERAPSRYGWTPFFFGFVILSVFLAQITGWRTILVPPLVVTGFEMFAHADVCPWAERPVLLPLICILTASSGLLFRVWLGTGPLAAACILVASIGVLKSTRLHIPPAIAIGLLAILVPHPGYIYPVAVGIGSILLTATFLLYRRTRRLWAA